MAKYRKILVAYDGSESSKNALNAAAQLARDDKSWIKVLAVVPLYNGDLELIGISNIKETIEGTGRNLLTEAKDIADKEDVNILTNLEQGEPYERIIHVADEENCDLIVMGRRGGSRLGRELMGSVTARVIGHTNRNVLIVPERVHIKWDNILLATDGSPGSQQACDLAIEVARERSAKLTAISVVYTNDEFITLTSKQINGMIGKAHNILDTFKNNAQKQGVSVETIVKEGEPYQAITELAAEIDASMIFLGSLGQKGLSRLLMGRVTERTIGYANCPIMVVH